MLVIGSQGRGPLFGNKGTTVWLNMSNHNNNNKDEEEEEDDDDDNGDKNDEVYSIAPQIIF